jgi:hypothetical protein
MAVKPPRSQTGKPFDLGRFRQRFALKQAREWHRVDRAIEQSAARHLELGKVEVGSTTPRDAFAKASPPPNPDRLRIQPVSVDDFTNARALVNHINGQAMYRTGHPFVPSGLFATCLSGWNLNWTELGVEVQTQAMARFLKLTSAMNTALFEPAVLKENLETHGLPTLPREARSALVFTSAENLKQLAPTYQSTAEMRRAEEAVARLQLAFVHNTNVLSAQPSGPVLSSHWLEKLGLGGGANTYPWNRDFLQTDNDVFFLPILTHPETSASTLAALNQKYGKNLVVVGNDYARKHGLISSFQMSANDFYDYAELASRTDAQLKPLFESMQRERWSWGERNPGNHHDTEWGVALARAFPKEMERLRSSLYKFDLTVSDFETLTKTTLLSTLDTIRKEDAGRFEGIVQHLETPNTDLSWEYQDLVLRALGFGDHPGFEYKAVGAVPAAALRVYRPDDEPTRRIDF